MTETSEFPILRRRGGTAIGDDRHPTPGRERKPAGREQAKLEYIEELGLALERLGLPGMAGRLLGALLVAEPPEQTAEELAETLQASRGSISAMTRLLEVPGIIERFRKPGDRRDYFRNRPDAWWQAMQREAASMSELRTLAEKGLTLVADAPPEVRRGLEDMREFYAFFEREMPKLLERWEHEHGRRDDRGRPVRAPAPPTGV